MSFSRYIFKHFAQSITEAKFPRIRAKRSLLYCAISGSRLNLEAKVKRAARPGHGSVRSLTSPGLRAAAATGSKLSQNYRQQTIPDRS